MAFDQHRCKCFSATLKQQLYTHNLYYELPFTYNYLNRLDNNYSNKFPDPPPPLTKCNVSSELCHQS